MTTYRVLTEKEKTLLAHIRVLEGAAADLCRDIRAERDHCPRTLAIARTQLEGACMWLTKALTNPTNAFKE